MSQPITQKLGLNLEDREKNTQQARSYLAQLRPNKWYLNRQTSLLGLYKPLHWVFNYSPMEKSYVSNYLAKL